MIEVWNSDDKAIKVNPKKMPLTAAVAEFLKIREWEDRIRILDGNEATELSFTTSGDGVSIFYSVESGEKTERLSVYGYSDFKVRPSRMAEMSRIINMINMNEPFGRFGCYDDEEANSVQFLLTYDLEGGSISGVQVNLMVQEAIRFFDVYHNTLSSVALTNTTAKKAWAVLLEQHGAAKAVEELLRNDNDVPNEL